MCGCHRPHHTGAGRSDDPRERGQDGILDLRLSQRRSCLVVGGWSGLQLQGRHCSGGLGVLSHIGRRGIGLRTGRVLFRCRAVQQGVREGKPQG